MTDTKKPIDMDAKSELLPKSEPTNPSSGDVRAHGKSVWSIPLASFRDPTIPRITSDVSSLNTSTAATTARTIGLLTVDDDLLSKYKALDSETAALRRRYEDQARALRTAQMTALGNEQKLRELERTKLNLETKERLGFILNRIGQDAQRHLFESKDFQAAFLSAEPCQAFVMSVDIRRSTELMLKARSPQHFSEFITSLCKDLMDIVIRSYGVFDKFTGDGVLAFFPKFYSGTDAAYRAILAADECHASFARHYEGFRKSFKSVLMDVGLGIGVDFGYVNLVEIAGGLTVVGEPVVYACRLSAAPAGRTFLNQPAYEKVTESFQANCDFSEAVLDIKHEGRMLAYDVRLNERSYEPASPGWLVGSGQVNV